MRKLKWLLLILTLGLSEQSFAACGATTRTWDGDNNYWSNNTAWTGNNRPNTTTENAIVPSAGAGYLWVYSGNQLASCVEVTSGLLAFWTNSLTVTGDYFKALSASSVYLGQNTGRLIMAGTAAQTLEMVDTLPNLTITNNTSVTFTNSFKSRTAPLMSGATTTLYIDDDFEITTASAWTIPSGNTVYIRNGAKVTLGSNLTVNGTLIIEAGGTLSIPNGRILSVPSGGLIKFNGSSGNPVTVDTPSGSTFTFNVAGSINAQYFRVSRLSANGIHATGTIQKMEFGEFHYLASSGYGITIGAATTLPSTMEGMGFFDENSVATGNINASAYAGSASDVYIDNWLGDMGGEANDTDTNGSCGGDPPGCIEWGSESATKLTITDVTASGSPPATLTPGGADTLFGTFAFALTKADTSSDITSVTFTHIGSASITEVDDIKIYRDAGGGTSCVYNPGTDTQIGGDLNLSGTPASATVSIPASTISVNNTSPVCIHLVSAASTLGVRNNTIGFSIASTSDVTNSQSYSFSESSGPPVTTDSSVINDGFASQWTGANSTNSTTSNNWFLNDPPSATENCQIGAGERICILQANMSCKTAHLPSAGTLDFNSTTRILNVYGNLTVESGYTFLNAASGTLNMRAAVNQGLEISEAFPGNLIINNTGIASNDQIIATGDSQIDGDVTLTNGTLVIGDGVTLTIGGNLTIQTGAEIKVQPGGSLILSDGSVVTVNLGGTLTLVGSASKNAILTSVDTSSSYTVVVNGNIAARYYTISRLGGNGLTIHSGATIDATNHLQNGQFTYPVTASTHFLRLFRAVPTNTMENMSFESGGSAAGSITNIYTDASVGAGTLTVTTYSGDLSGPTFDNDSTYLVSWIGATNTLNIVAGATTPATMSAGGNVNMGRFDFTQAQAGPSFSDTDLTSLKVTVTGTGNSSDVDGIDIFYDSDCNSSGGTLLGSQSPTGTPASATFSIGAGNATVEADATTPPSRCIYVVYDISSAASDGKTLGAKIDLSGDLTDSQSYGPSGTVIFPLTLGSPGTISGSSLTIWTGTTSTAWNLASNWTSGVPDATKSCEIPNAANDPIINGITAVCNTVNITSGILTFQNGTGAALEIYGNLEHTGTINQNDGTITLRDNGATPSNQQIEGSSAIPALTFNKTAGGEVNIGGDDDVTISNLTFPASQNFDFSITSGKKLILPNGVSIPSGVDFIMEGSSTLNIGDSQSLTLNGGTFTTLGVNDAYPQSTSNKALITRNGSGRWSFTANSGTLSLRGFLLDYLDTDGLNIAGSANLTNLDGGQFTNLEQDFATPVKAIQLNTSATVSETVASNVGFNWGAANSTYSSPPSPSPSDSYYLVYAPNCGSQSISFSQWFGDFWGTSPQPETQDKIHDSADGAFTCTVSIDASASPVTITSLGANEYNGTIDVLWTTAAEINHAGFNVYRSDAYASGYSQINSELIRSSMNNTSLSGNYTFRDSTVVNEKTYFYYVEDVAINGATTMHGPISAAASASLANAPALDDDDSGVDSTDGTPGSGSGGTHSIEVAPGVSILAQSGDSYRIEIIPGALGHSASTWNGSYSTISIPHYSSTVAAGYPELLERTILIPVSESSSQAQWDQVALTESGTTSLKVAPAPSWSANSSSGAMEPSWSIDNSIYSVDAFTQPDYYNVENETREISGKQYIAIHVRPVKYNPVQELYKISTKIVLDISLNENPWQAPGDLASDEAPLNATHVLDIMINKTGMYELEFDQLVTNNVDGPFVDKDTADLSLYYYNKQIPIEVLSDDNVFDSGDKIRFFAEHSYRDEEIFTHLTLSNQPLFSETALRITSASGAPNSGMQEQSTTLAKVEKEENNYDVFDRPIGGHVDHFFWKRIYVSPATSGAGVTSHGFDMIVENPSTHSDYELNVQLASRGSDANVNPNHKVAVYLNGSATASDTKSWVNNNVQIISFSIPANHFISGTNQFRLEVLADNLSGNEFSIVDIDKVQLNYTKGIKNSSNQQIVIRPDTNANIVAYNYSSEPLVYDISYMSSIEKLNAMAFNAIDETLSFAKESSAVSEDGAPIGLSGVRFAIVENDEFLAPTSYKLSTGFAQQLKSIRSADYLVIGHNKTLEAAADLLSHRQQQGLTPLAIDLQQIYNEFSGGHRSSQAIKDFLMFAYNHWTPLKPKYVLFMGDVSTDPLNHYNYLSETLSITRLISGEHSDFPSDLWFVSDEVQENIFVPKMAVGRIPSQSPAVIKDYISKIKAYESGEALSDQAINQLLFASDADHNSEGFEKMSLSLKQVAESAHSDFFGRTIKKDGTDADFKNQINAGFNNNSTFVMAFNGHGAEDMWSGMNVFSNSDANNLSNNSYPIAMAMNCLSGTYQSSDPTDKGIGETLVMAKEKGAIVFWGSSSLTSPSTQKAMAEQFYSYLGQGISSNNKSQRLGDVILQTQSSMPQISGYQDVLMSWGLIGDPALQFPTKAFPEESTATPSLTGNSSGSNGCSAFAGYTKNKRGTPWNLFFGFLIEVLLLIFALRFLSYVTRSSRNPLQTKPSKIKS